MAVNYMDRLAALRGDRQHAAGAHGHVSAPVLHADEHRRKRKKKRKLSRKQKAALAKGQKKLRAMHRAARRRAREEAGRGSMSKKRRHGRKRKHGHKRRAREAGEKRPRVTRGKKAVRRRKAYLARKRREGGMKVVLHGKAARRYAKRKHKKSRAGKVVLHGAVAARYARARKRKAPKRKRKKTMARKSSKRSRAAKKAARTRKHNKEMRRAAARRAARKRKRHGHKRGGHRRGHRRGHSRRAAPRRRKRGGRARRRTRGLIRRQNRTGKFVGRGGRIHGRKRRGGYHRAGRIVREGYSMENPLGMSELATGLVTGLVGYLAADITDRYLAAGRPPLGGTLYAEAAPIYSDYLRLGVGVLMGALPLVGAHFIDGARHAHIRAGLQFFGFGAGIRTLGHLVSDLISSQLKNNSMVGSTVQALYPHEIVSQGQLAGVAAAVAKQGAGALPEHVAAEVAGLGAIPEGLAACCNNSSRMLNTALSPLQPIGRNMEGGGSANPPPPVALPPPIERIVQQPYAPPSVMRQATPMPMTPAVPPPPSMTPGQPPARVAVPPAAISATPTPMVAAFAPAAPSAGVRGLPTGPFGWGEDAPG